MSLLEEEPNLGGSLKRKEHNKVKKEGRVTSTQIKKRRRQLKKKRKGEEELENDDGHGAEI